MDFALSEQQTFLQTTISEYVTSNVPLTVVRQMAMDDTTSSSMIADGLGGLGVSGVLIPEEYGGVGLNVLDAALIAECLGGGVVPYPFVGSSVMAVRAIAGAKDEGIKQTWLPKIASGETTVAVAIADHTGRRDSDGVHSDGEELTGQTMFAIDVEGADAVVVADVNGSLFLVSIDDVEVSELRSVDKTRSLAELKFESSTAQLLSDSAQDLNEVIAFGRIVLAADTLGAAQAMLGQAVDYAGERRQFNRVIGSFQAVKHLCAEMAADLEPCRSMVWYAAHSCDFIQEEMQLMTNHAKAHLSEVGKIVARKATEVHGGMGFTDLLGLHYWFKRIELNRQLLGSPNHIRKEIAKLQEWS